MAGSQRGTQSEELRFAQCMRANGLSNFPDPPADGAFLRAIAGAGIRTQSALYKAAFQGCEKYTPAGRLDPAQRADGEARGIQLSECMRSHGVPDFPDPTIGPTGAEAVNLTGLGIDQDSPTFQAARSICQKIVPTGK